MLMAFSNPEQFSLFRDGPCRIPSPFSRDMLFELHGAQLPNSMRVALAELEALPFCIY